MITVSFINCSAPKQPEISEISNENNIIDPIKIYKNLKIDKRNSKKINNKISKILQNGKNDQEDFLIPNPSNISPFNEPST